MRSGLVKTSMAVLLVISATTRAQETSVKPVQPPTVEQQQSVRKRMSIGVALEGGGALGIAHLGVLKWFEENHIPIDYLAGTSMGGLVGGLYSTGKSADELKTVVNDADWNLLLGGQTPYPDLAFRRKEDAREVPNGLEIGLKHGPTLPPGLNTGQQINLLIDRGTINYSTVTSFNQLPIPFRCVATELVSGKAHVFENGSLSEAMRATMSIPGVFDPVHTGGKVYVDGGIVNNLPTDVVRNMGADIVIGVHLQISETTEKEITSAFSVLGRSAALIVAETEIRGMAGADIIVRADVEKFTSMDYSKSDPLFKIGYEAAAARAQVLKGYALNDADWAEYMAWKNSRRRMNVGNPQFVKVIGVDADSAHEIEKMFHPLVGKTINTTEIDGYVSRLAGTNRYSTAAYSMIIEDDKEGLLVRVDEKSYAPPVLLPSFFIDGAEPSDVTFTLGGRVVAMDVWGKNSELRAALQFGGTYGLEAELYKPFTPYSHWYFEPFAGASRAAFNIYQKTDPLAEYQLDRVLGGVNVGYTFNRFNQLSVGYGIGYGSASLRLGQPEFSSISGRVGAFQMEYVRDHTNEPVIPTNGYYLDSKFRWFDTNPGATQAFGSEDLYAAYFHPALEKGTVFVIARGGSTFGAEGTGTPQFFLGGPSTLSSYGSNELFGNQYFLGRVGYFHSIFSLPPFLGKDVYLYGAGEVGKMYGDVNAPKLSGDGVAGVFIQTLFGPVLIGGSVGDTGHHKWFFELGHVF